MHLKHRFRLYPTPEQEVQLNAIIGANRFVWNHYLHREQETYNTTQKFNFFENNAVDLTTLKQAEQYGWLKDIPSTSLQQTLRNLNQALKMFLKHKNTDQHFGFPVHKKKKDHKGSFTLAMVNEGRNIDGDLFHVAKGLDVKFVQHRPLPSDFKTCQIKREADRWFVILTCDKEKQQLPLTGQEVGIDINSQEYVLSNGKRIAIPKYKGDSQAHIKHLKRDVSRKEKGSKNHKKAKLKVAKAEQAIADKRLDFFHKLSKKIIVNYDHIILEDLDVKGMQQNNRGRVIADNGFAMFRSMIEYKAELYGKCGTIIDRYYPSSQICSNCGNRHKMPDDDTDRIYECPNCEFTIDRDYNAALNIHRAGTARSGVITTKAFGGLIEQQGLPVSSNEEGSPVL